MILFASYARVLTACFCSLPKCWRFKKLMASWANVYYSISQSIQSLRRRHYPSMHQAPEGAYLVNRRFYNFDKRLSE